jgi:carbonic anhydrase
VGAIDELLARHRAGRATFAVGADDDQLTARPKLRITVLTCMDARINLFEALGLRRGDAHILRNAGGLATDDALRSLVLSQQMLGTQEIMVIQHTGCGLEGVRDADVAGRLAAYANGEVPPFTFGGFSDIDESVRTSMKLIRDCPWLVRRDAVRGFVYDVSDQSLREVL